MRCEVRDQQLKREEKSDRQVRFMRTHFVSIVLKKPLTVSRSCCIVASTPCRSKCEDGQDEHTSRRKCAVGGRNPKTDGDEDWEQQRRLCRGADHETD